MFKAVEIKKLKTLETETHWKADLSINFSYFEPPDQDSRGRPTDTELSLLQKLEGEVKKAADKRFGAGTIKITSQIKRHCLEIVITVVGLVATLVTVFSNYKKFVKGVEAFLGDLQKIAYRLHRIEKMGSSLPLTLTDIVLFFPYLIFNFSATFFSLETLW